MDNDDETSNPPELTDVESEVQPVTTHSWLASSDAPSSWAPPLSGSTPPPPPPPGHADVPPPAVPAIAPLPQVPAPPVAPAPTPAAASLSPARPMSGYDAPA